VSATLAQALNVFNRPNKPSKFGYSTSEDAVTWTVMSFLVSLPAQLQNAVWDRVCGMAAPAGQMPTTLVWGVGLPSSPSASKIRTQFENLADQVGEHPSYRTEPDIIVDFGEDGLLFVEVKYRSPNDVIKPKDFSKFDPYLNFGKAFTKPKQVKQTGLYELARNWCFLHALGQGRPVKLINLGPKSLFSGKTKPSKLSAFEQGLNLNVGSNPLSGFRQLTWKDFIDAIELYHLHAFGSGFPNWFANYLAIQKLP